MSLQDWALAGSTQGSLFVEYKNTGTASVGSLIRLYRTSWATTTCVASAAEPRPNETARLRSDVVRSPLATLQLVDLRCCTESVTSARCWSRRLAIGEKRSMPLSFWKIAMVRFR